MLRFAMPLLTFIKKERPYILFVVFILLFFLFVKFQMQDRATQELTVSEEMKQMDEVMEENLKNPEYLAAQLKNHPFLSLSVNTSIILGMLALGIGAILNILMIRKTWSGAPWLSAHSGTIEGDWGVSAVIRVVILFIFYSASSNFIFLGLQNFIPDSLRHNFLIMAHATLMDFLAVFFVIHFVKKSHVSALKAIGIRRFSEFWKEAFSGVKAYLATLPSFLMILFALISISMLFSYEPPPHPLIHIFLEEEKRAPWLVVYALLVACVLAPVVEEIFFRGFMYGALRKKWGAGWATVITSAFFAYIHNNWFAFLPIFFLSCVLCYLYEKRKTLITPVVLHVIHNSAFIFYFLLLKRLLVPEEW